MSYVLRAHRSNPALARLPEWIFAIGGPDSVWSPRCATDGDQVTLSPRSVMRSRGVVPCGSERQVDPGCRSLREASPQRRGWFRTDVTDPMDGTYPMDEYPHTRTWKNLSSIEYRPLPERAVRRLPVCTTGSLVTYQLSNDSGMVDSSTCLLSPGRGSCSTVERSRLNAM